MTARITYLRGDATRPIGDGPRVIVHVSNDIGAWGAGFVLAVSRRWPEPEAVYRRAGSWQLGDTQIVPVGGDLFVANMIAQQGVGSRNGPPILYEALETCLAAVAHWARENGATIHAPRFATGLAGGRWSEVEPIILRALDGLDVFVYDLPEAA